MIEIVADKHLAGTKAAFLCGRRILCSPAIYALISKAETEKELRFLLGNIPLKRGPDLDSIGNNLGMSISTIPHPGGASSAT